MTPEQLDEIERLYAAATPGEWKGDRLDGTVKYRLQSEACDCDSEELWNCPHVVLSVNHKNVTSGFLGRYGSENEKLVMALHNAFPAMVKALREARQERDVLQAVLNDWQRFGMEREKERDEARAEAAQLREVVRKVHALSGAMDKWPDVIDLKECGAKIHKLTKEKAKP